MAWKPPKIDLIPGTDQDLLILGVIAAAGAYIWLGNGAPERWKEAVGYGGPPAAALMYGKKKTEKTAKEAEERGFGKGFNTYNPKLHIDELVQVSQSPVGQAVMGAAGTVATGVAGGVVASVTDHAIERLLGRPDEAPLSRFTEGEATGQPDPPPRAAPVAVTEDDFDHLNVEGLRSLAREAGIEKAGGRSVHQARRADLVSKLVQRGIHPVHFSF